MTVNTISSIAEFDTNGVTTNFPFYFKFLANEDLVVTYVDPLGASSILTLGMHYTVNGAGNDQGGSIVTTSALAGPGQLAVSREMEAFQPTSLRNQGKFLAETHEDVFDRLTMLIQQGWATFGRALRRPLGRDYYDAESRRIANVADPVGQQDAATKNWVGIFIDSVSGQINNTLGIAYDAGNLFDYLKYGNNRTVDSIAALRALSSSRNQRATVLGYYGKGDGGGGVYYADLTDTTTADNGGTVIEADDGTRWKLATVDVVDIRQYGARSGSAISSSPQIQKAFDDGGTKSAADGVYLLGSTVSYDHSAADFPHTGDPSKRLTFLGNSMGNTIFEVATGLAIGFQLRGGISSGSQGGWGYSRFGNLSIIGKARSAIPVLRVGTGIDHKSLGYDHLSNISVQHMNEGFSIRDCLSNEYSNLYARENNFGFVISRSVVGGTLPNAMNFSKIVATGNSITGVYFDLMGAGNSWVGGSIEGNGTPGSPNSFGFKANLLGDNGLGCLDMRSGYFESNAGVADLDLDNVGTAPVNVMVSLTQFHRLSEAHHTTSNIRLRSTGGGTLNLILNGNGFVSGGDYVPSPTRPFIDVGPNCNVIGWDTCTYNETTSIPASFNSASAAVLSGSGDGATLALNAPTGVSLTRVGGAGAYRLTKAGGWSSSLSGFNFTITCLDPAAVQVLDYAKKVDVNTIEFGFRKDKTTPYTDAPFGFQVTKSK